VAKELPPTDLSGFLQFTISLFFNSKKELTMGQFEAGKTYLFNVEVQGVLWPINCMFTGDGEERNGVEYGYFVRIVDGKEGTRFCWNLETARANQPVSWGERKETWG